ncbi:MAG: helix-turn-helix domain-containing protein, partial [Pseudomonadota bacterium]
MARSLAGTRIRERRRALGLTQTALAAAAGISPSYLNLIEHNRRGAAGRVLTAIARALGSTPADLSEGPERALLGDLTEAAEAAPDQAAETAAVEEFIGRFPGWARLVGTLWRRSRDQGAAIAALTDRLAHDPFLAESLHSMLTHITAIRSTAQILNSTADLRPARRAAFERIVEEESARLSDVATALTEYFDRAGRPAEGPATPEEELDRFLEAAGHAFPHLDRVAETRPEDIPASVAALVAAAPGLTGAAARRRAVAHLMGYGADAAAMPLADLVARGEGARWDLDTLTTAFGTSHHALFRRLAVLRRPGVRAPGFGLILADAAGRARVPRQRKARHRPPHP